MPRSPDLCAVLFAAVEQSASPVALFDAGDTLRHANGAYAATFLRGLVPPVSFADILRHGFHSGFGVHIACGDVEAFLADVLPRRRSAPNRTVLTDTVDGRWLQFTETLLPDGWLLTVATDISALKQHERLITQAHASALQAALTDALTGVPNRRHALDLAEQALHARRSSELPVSVAVVDIDHFKQVNDSLGHLAGDQVLKDFCAHCRTQLRPNDIFGRIGGEEFLLVLPGADAAVAETIVERVREAHRAAVSSRFTFSAGIAEARAGEALEALLHRADTALYAAKRGGRDRSVIAGADVAAGQGKAPAR
jgi:diguanylate cyclase (GGDEF)-like protein